MAKFGVLSVFLLGMIALFYPRRPQAVTAQTPQSSEAVAGQASQSSKTTPEQGTQTL